MPDAEIDLAPLSDGGPGFVEVVHAALGGEIVPAVVTGPLGDARHGRGAARRRRGRRAAHRATSRPRRRAACTSSRPTGATPARPPPYGVGELDRRGDRRRRDADRRRARRLGDQRRRRGHARRARCDRRRTPADARRHGGAAAGAARSGRPRRRPRARVAGVELVAASDVDNPLLGLQRRQRRLRSAEGCRRGTRCSGSTPRSRAWAARHRPVARRRARRGRGRRARVRARAARRAPGCPASRRCSSSSGSTSGPPRADVVITGEGSFDWQSLRGKVVSGVAEAATGPAGRASCSPDGSRSGRREMAAMGAAAAYSLTEQAGSAEAAMAEAATPPGRPRRADRGGVVPRLSGARGRSVSEWG